MRNSSFSHFISGALSILFFAWFLLPTCACQWESIFGVDKVSPTSSQSLTFNLPEDVPSEDCHCHDVSSKHFESHFQSDELNPAKFQATLFVANLDEFHLTAIPEQISNRGPPPAISHRIAPRAAAYLRHCSFLI